MRLYAMTCGRLRCRKAAFVPQASKEEFIEAPAPVFAITHPGGTVLFDTGPHPDVFRDGGARWGGLAKAFQPIGDEASGVVEQLRSVGIAPSEVRYVVNSHLHFDHAGGNQFFPDATFLVAKREFELARDPEYETKGYIRADWDHPLRYREVEGDFDLYGDGKLVVKPLTGHTFGHQILLVRLERQGTVILSGDAAPCFENYDQLTPSRTNMDDTLALQGLHRLHELAEQENALLIHGHDPSQWARLKTAPEYYS